ncbi:MAG: tRNA preQ1(34) S-adenosylmethionine ribosyltransferase-isomerase QueA [Phycisphaeraceae bacterium]
MDTDALDYELPPDRIATAPVSPRDAARLMVCDRSTGRVHHRRVRDLPRLQGEGIPGPRQGDLMLTNTSRVVPARFFGTRSETGGRVEGLFLAEESAKTNEPASALPRWRAMFETRGKLRAGETVALHRGEEEGGGESSPHSLELLEPIGGGVWRCALRSRDGEPGTWAVLESIGSTPLPPYIRKARRLAGMAEQSAEDSERYNTVYAEAPGSVAAPTAGLHFTPELLAALDEAGVKRMSVTLHVGPGTFAPVRSERLEDHAMHAEQVEVPDNVVRAMAETRSRGGRVLAVGTTTVRAIESVPAAAAEQGKGMLGPTELFITPDNGFVFRFTDALMTNFHLPRSTLLGMVSALPGVGIDRLLTWYREAIDGEYRFYSYGDAMLVV